MRKVFKRICSILKIRPSSLRKSRHDDDWIRPIKFAFGYQLSPRNKLVQVVHEHSALFDSGGSFSVISKSLVDDILKSVQDTTHKHKKFEDEYMNVSGDMKRVYGVVEVRWRCSKIKSYLYQTIELKVVDLPKEGPQIIIGRPHVNEVATLKSGGLLHLRSFNRVSQTKKTSE